jgi:hypothetical protein
VGKKTSKTQEEGPYFYVVCDGDHFESKTTCVQVICKQTNLDVYRLFSHFKKLISTNLLEFCFFVV